MAPCGACKFLRRKCNSDCIFSPYFSYEEAAAVHKVFGASNVSKHLLQMPQHQRSVAAITIYEALFRMRDPVFGCVAQIFALHQQVVILQNEIEFLIGSQMTNFSYSNQSGSQLNNMPDFYDQSVDEISLLYNDGFFMNSEEMLVNHQWLQNMDYYYYAPQN